MPNVVLLCGTSGSGKTYIAERVLEQARLTHPGQEPARHVLRRKTSGYIWLGVPTVAVTGRYEAACGGCDAISYKGASDDIEDQVRIDLIRNHASVLVEGLIVASWGLERLRRVDDYARLVGGRLRVVHLTTSLEVCLASVNARRAERARARGREPTEVDPANTTAKWSGFRDGAARRLAAGLDVYELNRSEALARTMEWLGVPPG